MQFNKRRYWLVFSVVSVLLGRAVPAWGQTSAPVESIVHLQTRWARDMNPAAPLPEYPRPQLERGNWQNLNGVWQWAEAKEGEAPPFGKELPGKIVVPFPIESKLSGVTMHVERMWYRKTFEVTRPSQVQKVLLNFGAVDWEAVVYVNGKRIGEHRGGYDPFAFDISDAVTASGQQELIVGVYDPTDGGEQPRGKQVRKPEGIWYTPTTGIWQTVWLEAPKGANCRIEKLKITPNIDAGEVGVTVQIPTGAPDSVQLSVLLDGKLTASASGPPNQETLIRIPNAMLWSPESPTLYTLQLDGSYSDTVVGIASSYFAMRKVEVAKDEKGVNRIFLNGKPYFQVGPLDQGFWPDGLYTAPTDEALRADVEMIKKLGFNMVRKHVKVEPERWYYWADKLGVLVWQDMPSPMPPGGKWTEAGKKQYELELTRMIETLRNHPSIVMWVVFNEGWGQHDTARYVELVRKLDPTRLVNNASGWTDEKCGDVIDIHHYPAPKSPAPEAKRAAVLGEFGGLGLGVRDHTWKSQNWGYQNLGDNDALTRKYEAFLQEVYRLRDAAGLSAAVYTQLTDVETECNGLLTYDRVVIKPDLERVAAANRGDFSRIPPPPIIKKVAPTSEEAAQTWHYTFEKPDDAWTQPTFRHEKWSSGPGGFGTRGTPGAVIGTEWKSADIWLVREFKLDATSFTALSLRVHHDEDCEIYFNGVEAATLKGYTTDYEDVPVNAAPLAALHAGTNVLAVHCHQTTGGQFIDVGLVDVIPAASRPAGN